MLLDAFECTASLKLPLQKGGGLQRLISVCKFEHHKGKRNKAGSKMDEN